MLRALPVLRQVRDIEGWLLDDEIDLLLAVCARAVRELPDCAVVEVGSYCGRSTVVLATAVADAHTEGRVFAIDPHEGELGPPAPGAAAPAPTLERFNANVAAAGLQDHVATLQQRSYEVSWDEPIGLLLIDGMHDRENVERDFRHFEPWLHPRGYVAFHDYAHYYPDVVAFVDELLAGGAYTMVDRADSLVVLAPAAG
jgi:predicted O-methyltransferase YrrM